MGKEYLAYPGERFPGETWPFAATTVDDDTALVHSPKGWEWERVPTSEIPDYASIVPDLLGASQAAAETLEVPLDRVTPAGSVNAVSTAVVRELWSKVVTAEKGVFLQVTADMIEANAITADKISVGALDGQVITGATIRTSDTGSRVQLDASGMKVYNTDGDTTMNIDQSGDVEIFGRIGRKDSWSECYFNNIVSSDNGTDRDGDYLRGVGLVFTSRRFNHPGTISVNLNTTTNKGSISLHSPRVSSSSKFTSMLLAEDTFSVTNDASWFRILDNSFAIGAQNGSYGLSVSNAGIAFRRNNNGDFYSNAAGFGIGMGANKPNVWGTEANVVAGTSASRYIQINQSGAYTLQVNGGGLYVNGPQYATGSKQFIMPVPGHTEANGDKWLEHRCTESPWDGIEYWGVASLDSKGEGEYVLPSYYHDIVRDDVPAVVLCSGGMGASHAVLEGGTVKVSGVPGDTVSVLVKAARRIWRIDNSTGSIVPYEVADPDPEGSWLNNPTPAPLTQPAEAVRIVEDQVSSMYE